jgi:pyruvate, orthophosphate dikinase
MVDILRIGDGCNRTWPGEEVGSKAANMARMAALGLPVPPAFIVPIAICAGVNDKEAATAGEAERQMTEMLREGIAYLETATGRKLGDRRRPLLVSVRSGAAVSMPGMLDTVLDVGCTPAATRGLVRMTGNPGFAWDCRRRFLEGYAESVLGLDFSPFAATTGQILSDAGATNERDLDADGRERIVSAHEATIAKLDAEVPGDAMSALIASALGVCRSWMNAHACTYRKLQKLEHLQGTAVTVQAMVFGNRGRSSGSGVAFSRDPSSGGPVPVIDFLFDAQGEDVVSGRRTPQTEAALARVMPEALAQLRDVLARLEGHFRDVQDVEFTIEDGKLWLLQTRAAKRTPRAALRFAVDFVRAGLITPEEAVQRLEGLDPEALTITRFVGDGTAVAKGTGAAAGVAVGRAAFDSDAAQRLAEAGDPVILARPDASTADVAGFAAAAGMLTSAGGRTAHAALVARQMGKPCVVGCQALSVDREGHRGRLGATAIAEGDWISVDGDSGQVFLGQRKVVAELPESELAQFARWRAGIPVRQSA